MRFYSLVKFLCTLEVKKKCLMLGSIIYCFFSTAYRIITYYLWKPNFTTHFIYGYSTSKNEIQTFN